MIVLIGLRVGVSFRCFHPLDADVLAKIVQEGGEAIYFEGGTTERPLCCIEERMERNLIQRIPSMRDARSIVNF